MSTPITYQAIGLMSGSSLDGIDIACCEFQQRGDAISFTLLAAETILLTEAWQGRLLHLPDQSARILAQTHVYFGHYLAQLTRDFIERHQLDPDFIASHGHTVFHDPDRRYTTQIGDGAALAALTRRTVITDFRTQDIAINGEGTPIAPAADRYLFSEYDYLLNIGGIANLTLNRPGRPIAFDLSGANQVFNALAQLTGQPYDADGALARNGQLLPDLLHDVEALPYFEQRPPKSLANSWVQQTLLPYFLEHPASVEDRLHTAVQHLVQVTTRSIERLPQPPHAARTLLVTGGGAFNTFLIEELQTRLQSLGIQIVLPDPDIIHFKEAILMALMGLLRLQGRPNCFRSVTGARRDTVGGAIYHG